MLKERQRLILKNITEMFVKTGKPISSNDISSILSINYSSATIRHEMTVLGQFGYLEQIHTSSGRKPTTKGIQYYVDELMDDQDVSLNDKLKALFDGRNENVEYVLDQASKIVSDITNLATVVIKQNDSKEVLTQIQLNPLNDVSIIAIIITSSGNVYNKVFQITEKQSIADLKKLFNILNQRLIDTPLVELEKRLQAIVPIIKAQIKGLEKMFQSFIYDIVTFTKKSDYSHGISNIVMYQDIDPETRAKLIKIINNHSTFEKFLKEQDKDIIINNEGTSVIKQKYITKNSSGHIALIGPNRMEYATANALLRKIIEKIEKKYK